MTLRPSTTPQRVPLLSPFASSLPASPDPASDSLRAASPALMRFLATSLVDFAAACRLDYATSLVAESASASVCPPYVRGECALGTDVLEDKQEEFNCFAATVPHLVSMLLAPEGDPDAPDIPTPSSYAEAIEGPYSSKWQEAMDAEMASWKSTGTYVDQVTPPGANIVNGMWIFRVKRPPGSVPAFKVLYVARGFSQRQGVDFFQTFSPTPKMTTLRVLLHVTAQRDYELHSLDFSTTFLQGSLHEEIWLRRPPGFTGSFPPGTQWSLWRPVYGLRQAPREWHDTLRTTLAALGFAPSTSDPSLFLRTDTIMAPFYVLVYVDDLVFAIADTEALAHVKSELQKRHTSIDLAPPSDESVEPSGPYPKLVGCLMYLMTCTRPDLAYPLSLLARYVAPGRHRKVHWDAAKRVLRYLCSTSGMGLVLGGRGLVVLTGHADASWVDDLAMQRTSQGYTFSLGSGSVSWRSTRSSSDLSSSCEAEIYGGAMATQELRWLTYLLADLGEAPCSPPVLYVDNKAMLALCQEHRLEHKTKHIALRYFLARELQQRGQLRLAYVASQANTADVFTKALQPCDHQRFCTILRGDFVIHPELALPFLTGLLVGSFSRSFTRFTRIEYLEMSENCFAGPLPLAIFRMPSLTDVNAVKKIFSGGLPRRPAVYSAAASLASLDLVKNRLSGPIPAAFAKVPSLRLLSLYSNRLSGNIPPVLLQKYIIDLGGNQLSGDLSGQQIMSREFHFSGNRLTRNFNTIRFTQDLKVINVSDNLFSGSFPQIVCDRSGEVKTDFSRNRLTGAVPANCFKYGFFLEDIKLSHNNFSGSLQPFLKLPTYITALDLGLNKFTGSIPRGLTCPQLKYLDLQTNALTGPIPAFCKGKQPLTFRNLACIALSSPPNPLFSPSCSVLFPPSHSSQSCTPCCNTSLLDLTPRSSLLYPYPIPPVCLLLPPIPHPLRPHPRLLPGQAGPHHPQPCLQRPLRSANLTLPPAQPPFMPSTSPPTASPIPSPVQSDPSKSSCASASIITPSRQG
ncbi:unnamed protein product [Closterium sp. NIES-54]